MAAEDLSGHSKEELIRELNMVREAYRNAKERMLHFEARQDELQQTIVTLQQEREQLLRRIRDQDSGRVAAAQAESGQDTSAPHPVGFEAFTPAGQKRKLGEILLEAGVLSEQQLAEILEEQSQRPHSRLGSLVVERGITSEEIIARVLAAQLRLPYVDLERYEIVEAASLQIPEEIARRHECVAIDGDLNSITLAMANPLDLLAIENIEITCKRRVAAVVSKPSSVNAVINRSYSN